MFFFSAIIVISVIAVFMHCLYCSYHYFSNNYNCNYIS